MEIATLGFYGLFAALVFAPSLLRLAFLIIELIVWKPYQKGHDGFESGVTLNILGALISPGVPAYLIYKWQQCGPGCGNGVVFIFFIPVVWLIAIVAEKPLSSARTKNNRVSEESSREGFAQTRPDR